MPISTRCGRSQVVVICIISVALALALSIVSWHSYNATTPDSYQYFAGAKSLLAGHGFLDLSGQPQVIYSPGYSFALASVMPLINDLVLSGQLISLIASVLTLIPLILIVSHLFSKRVALITGLVYALLPLRIELSLQVLSESVYFLLIIIAFWLWLRETEEAPSWKRAVAMGIVLGFGFLVRPDAVAVGALLLGLSVPIFKKWWKTINWQFIIIASAILFIFVAPYVVYNHINTGHWTISEKGASNLRVGVLYSYGVPLAKLMRLDEGGTRIVAYHYTESKQQFIRRYLHNAKIEANAIKRLMGPFLTVCLILGLCAEVFACNRKKLLEWLPALAASMQSLLYLPVFHLEDRYVFLGSIPLVIFACWQLATRFGASENGRNRAFAGYALVLPVAIVAAMFLKSDIARIRSHQHQAEPAISSWVKAHTTSGSTVITSNAIVPYRAERLWRMLPYDEMERTVHYARYNKARYMLIQSTDYLSPSLKQLLQPRVVPGMLKPVNRWNDNSGAWAVLYEVVPG